MPKKVPRNLAEYITPLRMNGMRGRMLRVPPSGRRKKEILLIYGHHASLERMFGLAEDLSQYGTVTIPDLPGFGGMESFYKLGSKPTIDNLADYLAAFLKLKYKKKRVNIIAVSFGFLVVTRMLQKYPDLAKKVDILVSAVGFAHKTDFRASDKSRKLYALIAKFYSLSVPAWLLRYTVLTNPVLTHYYRAVAGRHSKLKDASIEERDKRIAFEVVLWQKNHLRTHMYTLNQMLEVDLCDMQVDLKVYHVGVRHDRYFNNHVVEQHLRVIYKDFEATPTSLSVHAPTVVATASEVAPFMPKKLRTILARSK